MRQLFQLSRLLHIYLSTALLALLLMFCVTGLVLNHSQWLERSYADKELIWSLPPELLAQLQVPAGQVWQPPVAALQAFIEAQAPHLGQPNEVNIDHDVQEILFDYQLPASYALVVFTPSAEVIVEYREAHWLSLMNDLHKGRHSGAVWSWVIDLSAVLMVLFALTGMIILLQNRKRRQAGLWFALLGLLTPLVLYFLFVPRL